MTDRERLDQIEQERYSRWELKLMSDGYNSLIEQETPEITWLVDLARRLLAVEEAARSGDYADMDAALADLDEWRKGHE